MDIASVGEELDDLEPVLTDWEVSVIEGRLRERWMGTVPTETRFITFIQEPKVIERNGRPYNLDAVAVFACMSPHPLYKKGPQIMTYGGTMLEDFFDARAEQDHFVKGEASDPALVLFGAVLKNHMQTLSNIKELIH